MASDFILSRELKLHVRYADELHYREWTMPDRIITDYLLLHIAEGAALLHMEGEAYELEHGQFVLVQPGVVHRFESLEPVTFMAMHVDLFPLEAGQILPMFISAEQLESLTIGQLQPSLASFADIEVPLLIRPARPEWMIETLGRVIAHWGRNNALDRLQAQVCATEIVIDILQRYLVHSKNSTDLTWVPAYMQYRLSERITVEEMAQKAFMSRSHFSQLFHEQFGIAPHQYLLRLRLETAMNQLATSDLPMKDIAFRYGFSSVHHFSKMFKQHFGQPPSHYRELQ
ncbi:helix-turn-helix domain-containing protein [Paenibacillus sp. HB172176]|uniref:helix-turn-helix transcriptional regulator n=2 Tax=Paenibacillus sp. HB172176 TaxID=2493690 RepID=UPI00143BAD65|nr:helix-turn-helix domain-containing protein [Paenibacillus sp. HB172176]